MLRYVFRTIYVHKYLGNILSSHTFFSKSNGTASYSLKSAFRVRKSVFLIPPTANLPNRILTPRVASWWKNNILQPSRQRTKSKITDSTQPKKPYKTPLNQLIYLQCIKLIAFPCHLRLFLLCVPSLVTRESMSLRRQGREKWLCNLLILVYSTYFNR